MWNDIFNTYLDSFYGPTYELAEDESEVDLSDAYSSDITEVVERSVSKKSAQRQLMIMLQINVPKKEAEALSSLAYINQLEQRLKQMEAYRADLEQRLQRLEDRLNEL